MERAIILCNERVIRRSDLPEEFQSISPVQSGYFNLRVGSTLEEMEKELIRRTIEFSGGNKRRAAQVLGVSPKTLYNKLERYGQQGE
jgi:DNA-binding NtrC family response regulator